MYDFIGDVHGHADKLEALLKKLGYERRNGHYSHPERKVLFVGDYIDRGPKIRETLEIVKRMVEEEAAIALMGNHEYNALCFHFQESEGGHLRKHLIKNIIQHYETLRQFQNQQKEYEKYIDWFKTLPLYYETDNFRAVHACWDPAHISFLRNTLVDNRLTDELIHQSVIKETKLHTAIEETLKGKEIKLPRYVSFKDKDGEIRHEIRIRWWEDLSKSTYKQVSIVALDELQDSAVDLSLISENGHYTPDEKPVFFGHYWLNGQPSLFRENVCCLDYSVAKGGKLVAYRFEGEKELRSEGLVFV
jgi:hypothetical protein